MRGAQPGTQVVSSVEIFGVPAAFPLKTRPGAALDADKLRDDVKALWKTGQFSDIRVETVPDGGGLRVMFRVRGRQTVRIAKVRVDPPIPGVKVDLPPMAELDNRGVQQIAARVHRQLEDAGYPDARVNAELHPAAHGRADLVVHVDKGRSLDIGDVTFSGSLGAKPSDLRKALRATKSRTLLPAVPGLWHGWKLQPAYTSGAAQSDADSLLSFYYKHNYFDAKVRIGEVQIERGKARIRYEIESGPRYGISAFSLAGGNGVRQVLPPRDVCGALFRERRQAERAGVVDFNATIEVREAAGEPRKRVDLVATIRRGREYSAGRIEFHGNHRISDSAIRRSMLLDEGAPLDETLLRRSIARLNRTGLFEPLTERSVVVNTPPESDRASITIWLKEKKPRHWFLSGPVGPMSVAGPLEFSIGSRLPSWGRGVFELATYTAASNFMLLPKPLASLLPFLPNKRFLALFTIRRPSLPGQAFLSGFTITPQYGWEGLAASYGISQARSFVTPLLASKRDEQPALPAGIERAGSNGPAGIMYCEEPKAPLDWARRVAGMVLNSALPGPI
jgi:Surface antigen variable number repeat